MLALAVLRVDQNNVRLLPGATATTSDVKNSMRGALGFRLRDGVGSSGAGVLVGPNNGVRDGPPVGDTGISVGVIVGVAFGPGVRVGEGVKVGVLVGKSVGTICTAVAPQALRASAKITNTTKRAKTRSVAMNPCSMNFNLRTSITLSRGVWLGVQHGENVKVRGAAITTPPYIIANATPAPPQSASDPLRSLRGAAPETAGAPAVRRGFPAVHPSQSPA